MFLGLIESLKDYFSNLSDRTLVDLIPFLTGLILGFILCVLIYVLVFLISYKKDIKKIDIISTDNEIINIKLENAKNRYISEASSKKTSEKIGLLKEISWELANDVASSYYPDSSHPLFELSINELIDLDYYIIHKIESIFSKPVLKLTKKMRLSTIIKMVDKGKKINENKVVKTAEKVKPVVNGFWATVNLVNPVYWVKKLMFDLPISRIMNTIALVIIDIIGTETSNVYSKRAFESDEPETIDKDKKNNKIDKEIKEIEKMIGDADNE